MEQEFSKSDEAGPAARDFSALLAVSRAVGKCRDCDSLFEALADALASAAMADDLRVHVPSWQGGAGGRFAPGAVASLLASVAQRGVAQRYVADGGMAAIALPLLAGDTSLGAIALGSRRKDALGDAALLEDIASTVAIAVDRCLGYEDLERRSRERDALLDVNRAIGRHLHRDELFGALARCLESIVPTQRFGIELPIEGDRLQGHLLTPVAQQQPTQPTILPAPGTACDWVLRNRAWIVSGDRDELRERFPITFEIMERENMQSLCALPLVTGERCRGVLFFMTAAEAAYAHLRRDLLEEVAAAVAAALDDCLAHEEVGRLRDRLAVENVYLQEEIRSEHNFVEIVGNSAPLLEVLRAIEQVAPTDATALILGETGTGKELIARAIHDRSARRDRPLVKVNCAAISPGLVESELFGHVKGAFTGALQNRDGRFQVADGGTIFLDEVGELSPETQAKLLRVLQEREFEPIGSSRTIRVDVRVIAATNRDLRAAVRDGKFRSDLFYRLNVFPLQIPPLRERRGDLALLVPFFVQRFAKQFGKQASRVSDATMRRLADYAWPGNVRELQNILERAVVLSNGPLLQVDDRVLPVAATRAETPVAVAGNGGNGNVSLEEFERRHILEVLAAAKWKIEGERGAARLLDLQPSTLRSRMRKLGIARPT